MAIHEHILRAAPTEIGGTSDSFLIESILHHQRTMASRNKQPLTPQPAQLGFGAEDMLNRLEERLISMCSGLAAQQERLQVTLEAQTEATHDVARKSESALREASALYEASTSVARFSGLHSTSPPGLPNASPVSPVPSDGGGSNLVSSLEESTAVSKPRMRRASTTRIGLQGDEDLLKDEDSNWSLVSADPDIGVALKDVRGKISDHVDRTQRKQPKIADLESEGTLYIQLLRARDLMPADDNGLSDPYAKVSLGEDKQRSRKMKRTLDPVWHDEVFAFQGVLGQLVDHPLKFTMWDFDLYSTDDQLGYVEIELADHTYCNEIRREITAYFDTQGEVVLAVWWEPEDLNEDGDRKVPGRRSKFGKSQAKEPWYRQLLGYVYNLIPERFRTLKGCCASCCIAVLHPESRFRSGWNVALAFFILYCGIAVPLEIAFETDMVREMCTDPYNPHGPLIVRGECTQFLQWFWLNFIVDVWFIADIYLNFRTGFMHEGHFVADDWLVAKAYLKGSFLMDVLGTFPLNIVMMVANPENPYGDAQVAAMLSAGEAEGAGMDPGRANRMLRLMRMAKLAKLARMRKLAKTMEAFEEFLNPGVLAVMKVCTKRTPRALDLGLCRFSECLRCARLAPPHPATPPPLTRSYPHEHHSWSSSPSSAATSLAASGG